MKKKHVFLIVFGLVLAAGAMAVGKILLENQGMAVPASLYWKGYVNLVPFATLGSYVLRIWEGTINVVYFARFLASTFLLFLGVGYFARMRWGRKEILCAAMAVCTAKELMQGLLRMGSCDIDTVIFSALGCLFGMWACERTARKRSGVDA